MDELDNNILIPELKGVILMESICIHYELFNCCCFTTSLLTGENMLFTYLIS